MLMSDCRRTASQPSVNESANNNVLEGRVSVAGLPDQAREWTAIRHLHCPVSDAP